MEKEVEEMDKVSRPDNREADGLAKLMQPPSPLMDVIFANELKEIVMLEDTDEVEKLDEKPIAPLAV